MSRLLPEAGSSPSSGSGGRHARTRGIALLRTNLREAGANLLAARQRSILALIGIVIGVGSVIALVSVGRIVQNEAIDRFKALGTDILTVRRVSANGATKRPFDVDEASRLAALPAIGSLTSHVTRESIAAHAGKRFGFFNLIVGDESFNAFLGLRLANGRFVSSLDGDRAYCVVGSAVARALRGKGVQQVVGEALVVGDLYLTIVGVLEPAPALRGDLDVNHAAMLPIGTGRRYFGMEEVGSITARIRPGVHHLEAVRQVERQVARFSTKLRVRIQTAQALIEQMQKQSKMMTLLLATIGSISLIVGGIGIMNVMLVAVTERRLEIGIRRALGARQGDIRSQFLIESVILSLSGGVIGVVLGTGTSYAICEFTGWAFSVSTLAVAVGTAVSSAIGVFFGFFPAYQASRLDTILVLRGA